MSSVKQHEIINGSLHNNYHYICLFQLCLSPVQVYDNSYVNLHLVSVAEDKRHETFACEVDIIDLCCQFLNSILFKKILRGPEYDQIKRSSLSKSAIKQILT